jgi:hypothetical protein
MVYAFKSIRDAIADLTLPGLAGGKADGDERLEWAYNQEIGLYGIKIEIEEKDNG